LYNVINVIEYQEAVDAYTGNVGRRVFDCEESVDEEKLNKMQLKLRICSQCRMSDER